MMFEKGFLAGPIPTFTITSFESNSVASGSSPQASVYELFAHLSGQQMRSHPHQRRPSTEKEEVEGGGEERRTFLAHIP